FHLSSTGLGGRSGSKRVRVSVAVISRARSALPLPLRQKPHRWERCCARAASGHAAAPPSSVLNSRRFIVVVFVCGHAITTRWHLASRYKAFGHKVIGPARAKSI